jgi:signal transduction histidine kinase
MHDEHTRAEATAQTAVAVAAIGALLALLLAGYHGRRVRGRVLGPLGALVDLTRQIGAGRVPTTALDGDAEVVAVGVALKQLATDLHEREARLVASERLAAVGQLAAGVAHEVNNPIGIIRGYLRTMIPEARDAQLKDELRILDEEAHACQRIAEDLVAFSRTSELRREEVEVASVIADIAQRLEASGELHGAHVKVAAEACAISLDAGRIRQVVSNLVRNAADAAPEGIIEVVGSSSDGAYRIEVRDQGPGVGEADRDRIFEPFFGRRPGGSGLGLAVCIGVVRAHGGSIRVTERDGGGAIFVVELPRTRERMAA